MVQRAARILSGDALPNGGSYEGQIVYRVASGDTVQMELTFESNGEKNQEEPDVGFYLSTNSIISNNDTLLDDQTFFLVRNTPYEMDKNITIPSDTS